MGIVSTVFNLPDKLTLGHLAGTIEGARVKAVSRGVTGPSQQKNGSAPEIVRL
jgi:hypothetical protein